VREAHAKLTLPRTVQTSSKDHEFNKTEALLLEARRRCASKNKIPGVNSIPIEYEATAFEEGCGGGTPTQGNTAPCTSVHSVRLQKELV
jgi:hypothetical protein